ncbi:MAG: hypothetical protein WCC58_10870 [Burkholderiales bacterium]
MQVNIGFLCIKAIYFTALGAALLPDCNRAETLGRLFYTPQERRQLDAARSAKTVKPPVIAPLPRTKPDPSLGAAQIANAAPRQARETVINGFVRRSDGPNTVWVNDKPVSGHAARDEWLQPSAVNSPVRVQSSSR